MIDVVVEPLIPPQDFGPPARPGHWEAFIDLFDRYLGTGYLTGEEVRSLLAENTLSAAYIALTGKVPVRCIGGAIVYVLSQHEWKHYSHYVPGIETTDLHEKAKVALLKALVVDKDFRKQGIGRALVNRVLKQCRQWGCSAVLAISWLPSNGQDSSMPLFKSAGFEVLSIKKHYWQHSSRVQQYRCPACGEPPCYCNAAFMLRRYLN